MLCIETVRLSDPTQAEIKIDTGGSGADSTMRLAAFAAVRGLADSNPVLTGKQLAAGFQFQSETIHLVNPRGIFKPRQMDHLLSIKTVVPKPGGRVWYEDQLEAHTQIFKGDDLIDYSFAGDDPDARDNRLLRDAMERQIPLIYFLGISPGRYHALLPTFIVDFDPRALKAKVAFSPSETATAAPQTIGERRYALRTVQQRLHQVSFREIVIAAYRGRCAISGLPEPMLLDAAHILEDKNEQYGQPIIGNGLPLSKIHHAAFDKNLIGIDADKVIHVSERLRSLKDGPTLEALKQLHGTSLRPPKREVDSPDRDRLAIRFERFKVSAA